MLKTKEKKKKRKKIWFHFYVVLHKICELYYISLDGQFIGLFEEYQKGSHCKISFHLPVGQRSHAVATGNRAFY